jgi:uncharacterized protein involved in outer membrane biogenesis
MYAEIFMKRLLKWLAIVTLVLMGLAVILLLSLDTIIRVMAEKGIRERTGMEVEIGKFHLGLLEPVVTIKDFKIHNPPDFGGTPFLNIPEIHVEYDRDALRKNEVHLTLVRFNLGELDIVKNEAGRTNIFSLGANLAAKGRGDDGQKLERLKQQTGLTFKGVDVLNVSVGSAKFIDLKNPANNREQKIGIDNLVVKNIRSAADLAGLAVLVKLRSGDFFTRTFGSGSNPW